MADRITSLDCDVKDYDVYLIFLMNVISVTVVNDVIQHLLHFVDIETMIYILLANVSYFYFTNLQFYDS